MCAHGEVTAAHGPKLQVAHAAKQEKRSSGLCRASPTAKVGALEVEILL